VIGALYARKSTRPAPHGLTLLVVLAVFASSGCSHYWTRPPATLEEFAIDHRECLEANSLPIVNKPGYGVVDEQAFRRCLISRGWVRRQAPTEDVPAGYFRGYEERELEPIRLDSLPEQPPAATGVKPSTSLNRCRELYADPRLRKICADRDAGTR